MLGWSKSAGWIVVVAAAAGAALSLSNGACVSVQASYHCATGAACVDSSGKQGVCEANGLCGFADPHCQASGRSYGPEGAPDNLKGTCVPAGSSCGGLASVGTSGTDERPSLADLEAGLAHTCLVQKNGPVWCWGDNSTGQLGNGTTQGGPTPVQVSGLPDPKTDPVIELSLGFGHSCALVKSGDVWCWGDNGDGEVGQSDSAGDPDPAVVLKPMKVPGIQGATYLSAGSKHTCAVVADGQVYCWGENGSGQLGRGDAQGSGMDGGVVGPEEALPKPVVNFKGAPDQTSSPFMHSMVAVENCDESTCAIRDEGSTFCWGGNKNGQLGIGGTDGDTTNHNVPETVPISSVSSIAAGDEHLCVTKGDHSVFCWGYNGSGALGKGDTGADVLTPVQIAFSASYLRSNAIAFHTCAIQANSSDGLLYCWGANDKGQIGVGTTSTGGVSKPTRVPLASVIDVAVGGAHTCALLQDGSLYCWGANDKGQLGLPPGDAVSTPTLVPGIATMCP